MPGFMGGAPAMPGSSAPTKEASHVDLGADTVGFRGLSKQAGYCSVVF